jgi:hypothetical protein
MNYQISYKYGSSSNSKIEKKERAKTAKQGEIDTVLIHSMFYTKENSQ